MNTLIHQTITVADGQYNLLLIQGEKASVSEAEALFAEKNAKPALVSDSPLFWLGYDAYFNRVSLAEMTGPEERAGWREAQRDRRAWRKAEMAVYA